MTGMQDNPVENISYISGVTAFVVLGVIALINYRVAVLVGLAWAIAGISKRNATVERNDPQSH